MAHEYVLGTDDTELARLGLQHQLWSARAHEAWERARIGAGSRVLDVGCGPGYASADLAHLVGASGMVLGVDESAPFVGAARRRAEVLGLPQATFVTSDVRDLEGAGVQPGSFDVVWARWVLCFVPDPEPVMRGIHAALRPGGRLVIHDYFNWQAMRIAPESEAYKAAMRAADRAWAASKSDPDVVATLLPMARRLGFEEIDMRVHQRFARPGASLWAWPDTFWRSFVPRLVQGGHMTEAEADAFFEDWDAHASNPDAIVHTPPVYEVIFRKP